MGVPRAPWERGWCHDEMRLVKLAVIKNSLGVCPPMEIKMLSEVEMLLQKGIWYIKMAINGLLYAFQQDENWAFFFFKLPLSFIQIWYVSLDFLCIVPHFISWKEHSMLAIWEMIQAPCPLSPSNPICSTKHKGIVSKPSIPRPLYVVYPQSLLEYWPAFSR